jgi:UDP-4-keto-D-FucNAc 4-reductase
LIAITGASGYVGAHCVAHALKRDHQVVAISTQAARADTARVSTALRWQQIESYGALSHADWVMRFRGLSAVIHVAARVHQARSNATESQMQRDNVALSTRLARAATEAGVSRFVYLSSAAVYGDIGAITPFNETSELNPMSAYARSKANAERALMEIAGASAIQLSILRPPVIYGRDAPGNVARLARAISRGVPMPFARVDNRRSMVAIETVATCAVECAETPGLHTETTRIVLPTDRTAISTKAMVAALARGMRRSPRLVPIPPALIRLGLSAIGAKRVANQLLDDWMLDGSALQRAGFAQQIDSEIGLELMGRSYNAR